MTFEPAPSVDVLYQFEDYLEVFLKNLFQARGFDNVYTILQDRDVEMLIPRLCIASAAMDSEQEDIRIHEGTGVQYFRTAAVDVDFILLSERTDQALHRDWKGRVREIMQRICYLSNDSPDLPYHRIVRAISQKPTHDLDPELNRETSMQPYQLVMQVREEAWPDEVPE